MLFKKNQSSKLKEDEKIILTDEEMTFITCNGNEKVSSEFIDNLGKKQ